MARRLAKTLLSIGLTAVSATSFAQTGASTNSSRLLALQSDAKPQSTTPGDAKPQVEQPVKPARDSETVAPRKDDRRGGRDSGGRDDHRPGDRHDGDKRDGDRRNSFRSVMDAIRRDGGPLELVPLLLSKSALNELGLDESVKTDVDAYFSGLQKKWEEERKAADENTKAAQSVPMSERIAKVSEGFNEIYKKLTPEQRDRVLGAFVQWRKFRSLSNRMIAVDKMGMTDGEAAELRQAIETIRDEVMSESRDKFRQLWENGRDRSEAELLMHKNREKIDERIKAKLTPAQIEKFQALHGKPISAEVLKSLDIPPPPPPSRAR